MKPNVLPTVLKPTVLHTVSRGGYCEKNDEVEQLLPLFAPVLRHLPQMLPCQRWSSFTAKWLQREAKWL